MEKQQIRNVLILCTGNFCRSQMAKALINEKLSDTWLSYSVGTEPSGYVHLLALKALKELGVMHIGRSKHIDNLPKVEFDIVITVRSRPA